MDVQDELSTRIYFQNINGLQIMTDPDRWKNHNLMMKETGCEIYGLAEINTNLGFQNIK